MRPGAYRFEVPGFLLLSRPEKPVHAVLLCCRKDQEDHMTFKERLEELLNRIHVEDTRQDINEKVFFKWGMQAHWLLLQHLGEYHTYTTAFELTVKGDDKCSFLKEIVAGQGILEALLQDYESRHIEINETGTVSDSEVG